MRRTKEGLASSRLLAFWKIVGCGVLCAAVSARARGSDNPIMIGGSAASAAVSVAGGGAGEGLLGGRVELSEDTGDPALRSAIGLELRRLAVELHERQGWRVPVADGDPLRIAIAHRGSEGLRRIAVRSIANGRLVAPLLQLDATGLSGREVVREVSRLYAFATLAAYGAADSTFLTAAAADYLSSGSDTDEDRERTRIAAAAPSVDVWEHPVSIGRLYVEEFARASGGPVALRALWEKGAETGEQLFPLLLKAYVETSGEKEEMLLLKTAARLYASYETDPAPSRVSMSDLLFSGLDAATGAAFAFRHRTTLPTGEAGSALRVSWPEQSAPAAAVVRYRDAALPADVVFFAPGRVRTIPLSGVARIDWVVGGTLAGPPLSGARALVEAVDAFPYASLSAQAAAAAGGPRLVWTTASHEDMLGWAVFREEVLSDGRIARTGPHMIPSAIEGQDSFRYTFVDSEASPGTFYRYTVWAVTEDGLLARAFSATLRTPE